MRPNHLPFLILIFLLSTRRFPENATLSENAVNYFALTCTSEWSYCSNFSATLCCGARLRWIWSIPLRRLLKRNYLFLRTGTNMNTLRGLKGRSKFTTAGIRRVGLSLTDWPWWPVMREGREWLFISNAATHNLMRLNSWHAHVVTIGHLLDIFYTFQNPFPSIIVNSHMHPIPTFGSEASAGLC